MGRVIPLSTLLPLPKILDGFTPEEFRFRRDALRSSCPDGLILINGAVEPEDSSPLPFRQNSPLYYLTGIEAPGATLVLLPTSAPAYLGVRDAHEGIHEILFLPPRNLERETWTGPRPGSDSQTQTESGIERIMDANSLWGSLIGWLRYCPIAYTVAPYGSGAKLTPEYAFMHRIQEIAPIVQFKDIGPALASLRMIKSSAEESKICEAITITDKALRAAREFIQMGNGRYEYEVEAIILETFRNHGAYSAFSPIVGSGQFSTALHYENNNAMLNDGDTVVVDIGARVGRYCADLTRTFPVGGHFSPRQREIYSLVADAHQFLVEDYKPGDTLEDLTRHCKEFLKNSPLHITNSLGIELTMENYMPHGVSHHLGLDVHDVGDRTRALIPGNVITIEPGIYLPEEGIGVRLEDDYLVTPGGLKRLGESCSFRLDSIESGN